MTPITTRWERPSMADKRKTKQEFIRQAIKEAVKRVKPELHAASEAAHQLVDEAETECGF